MANGCEVLGDIATACDTAADHTSRMVNQIGIGRRLPADPCRFSFLLAGRYGP
jgi:hypothetical protein